MDAEMRSVSVFASPMGACLLAVCTPFFNRIIRESDSSHTKMIKRTAVVTWLATATTGTIACFLYQEELLSSFWFLLSAVGTIVCPVWCLIRTMVTKTVPPWLISTSVAAFTILVILPLDLTRIRLMNGRGWYLATIVLDVCLLCRLPTIVPMSALAITAVWLLVSQAFLFYDTSFFTDPLSTSYEGVPDVCDCTHPPCADANVGRALRALLAPLFVLRLLPNTAVRTKCRTRAKRHADIDRHRRAHCNTAVGVRPRVGTADLGRAAQPCIDAPAAVLCVRAYPAQPARVQAVPAEGVVRRQRVDCGCGPVQQHASRRGRGRPAGWRRVHRHQRVDGAVGGVRRRDGGCDSGSQPCDPRLHPRTRRVRGEDDGRLVHGGVHDC
eukprot:Rhum_TRINITY_DN14911_c0_g1::Rhum_TRINITY_DN14911_c0_g1_i4::g.127111::m.127111